MSDVRVGNVEVTYRDNEPHRLTVPTSRWSGDFRYEQEYTFKMDGSSAVLVSLEGDKGAYPVRANEETRELAKETVEELPFVQGVVMFE